MTTTDITTRYESFLFAARSTIAPSVHAWYTPGAIAALAAEQESCVWHAAWTLSMAHLDELGYATCRYCGGVTAPNQDGAHHLCVARQRRGVPTPMLDASPRCSCAPCMATVD